MSVTASTKKVANRAPWGLGANFVEFVPGGARGTLTLSFDGADGFAWRALVALTPASGERIQCGARHAQCRQRRLRSTSVDSVRGGAKATLMPTIADANGAAVPFTYGATIQ